MEGSKDRTFLFLIPIIKEVVEMATRNSMDECIQKCEDAIRYAQQQYKAGSQQEHYHDVEYTQAMQQLEEAVNDVAHMANSANSQQREQLHRMRLQLQTLQNEMILLDHDPNVVGGKLH
jgi:esterase/lipase